MKKKYVVVLILSILCTLLMVMNVKSNETKEDVEKQQELQNTLMEQFEFQELDQIMKDVFPKEKTSFQSVLVLFLEGDMKAVWEEIKQLVWDRVTYELSYNKEALVHIFLLGIIAAVFTNFSSVFTNKQVSEISFYIIYILLITIGLNSFMVVMQSVEENISLLLSFMKILGPVYFLGVAFSTGSVSSMAFYGMILFLIFLIELLILQFLLPMIHIYVMMKVLNHITGEEYLSHFSEFIETIIVWTLKTLLTCVVGLNLIQGMISPAIDSVKRSVWTKGLEAIPGVGDMFGGVTHVLFGTAVLIKNGIGAVGAVICIIICMGPIVKIAIITLMYKLAAALIQPISDKRIVNCISSIGNACQLLLRITYTTAILFLITIAVIAATTGR